MMHRHEHASAGVGLTFSAHLALKRHDQPTKCGVAHPGATLLRGISRPAQAQRGRLGDGSGERKRPLRVPGRSSYVACTLLFA